MISRRLPLLFLVAALVAVTPDLVTSLAWWASGTATDGSATRALSPLPSGDGWPRNLLVVGNDSRDRFRAEAGDRFGPAGTRFGERADVVMVVQVRPGGGPPRLLSIPRDLLVEVDGYGPQRLSTALEYGGGALLVRTVRALTDLPLHHYVDIDFLGFAAAIDRLGGVLMEFPEAARDVQSGLEVGAGPQRLDGWMALALVRSRNYEVWRHGEWVFVDDGDAGRVSRQHRLVQAVIAAARAHPSSPAGKVAALRAVADHVRVDSRLLLDDALRMSRALATTRPIELHVLPSEATLSDAARTSPFPPLHLGTLDYQRMVEPDGGRVLARFAR